MASGFVSPSHIAATVNVKLPSTSIGLVLLGLDMHGYKGPSPSDAGDGDRLLEGSQGGIRLLSPAMKT